MNKTELAKSVIKILKKEYPNPKTELIHKNETELAVAVMLSAQTTDKKVNEVTGTLFKKYKSWNDYAEADLETLRKDLHGVNFHKGKAERIIKAGQTIISEFGGKLPKKIEDLIKIPGVARKSANVIQQELWDIAEGVVVDTHVIRVSNRLGLSSDKNAKKKDAVKIEQELMKIIPKNSWRFISSALVLHGRYVCKARKPDCENCRLNHVCSSAFKV